MIRKVFLRSAYNYDADEVSAETGQPTGDDPSMTQQQFAEECDINTIVRRFGLTGELPNGVAMPQYRDFTDVTDYHTAMNVVRQAEEAFLTIPGEIRARFGHDPARVIAFMEDVNNRDEAIKLGFIAKPAEVARDGSVPGAEAVLGGVK